MWSLKGFLVVATECTGLSEGVGGSPPVKKFFYLEDLVGGLCGNEYFLFDLFPSI